MSSNDKAEAVLAISVQNVSKAFDIYEKPYHRLMQFFSSRPQTWSKQFWALQNVSFDVKKGETVGIVGRNGAGKSTLLQIITRTLSPTKGEVAVNGRIAALLELGAGFNMEFTGRENVFMNGMLLGMSKEELQDKYDEIVEFSGIGQFIEQPVKTYSSGMFARLAFSVAVHSEPSVLIVDEALSVGDSAFQEKSVTRMKEIRDSGTSILFVTHSLPIVRNFCDRAVWLEKGKVKAVGERLSICEQYQLTVDEEIKRDKTQSLAAVKPDSQKPTAATKTIEIIAVRMDSDHYQLGGNICIDIKLRYESLPSAFGVGVLIHDARGNLVAVLNTLRDDLVLTERYDFVRLEINDHHFSPGEYAVTISVSDIDAMFSYDRMDHACQFFVIGKYSKRGLPTVEGYVRCSHEWHY
ncbi:ABC transporter ATP-binding protein [Cupriavidus taiwanensis]|uniref:ABC-type polysaccharide/polyol phosphate transport system, ATPase component n=1 Tax=Cupriavidus taiwanensis TaxID=164546 RepID=A0A7Z7NLV1_9BURK